MMKYNDLKHGINLAMPYDRMQSLEMPITDGQSSNTKEITMKKLGKRFEETMEAITFAEMGESRTARELMGRTVTRQAEAAGTQESSLANKFEETMDATAFAESGEMVAARGFMDEPKKTGKLSEEPAAVVEAHNRAVRKEVRRSRFADAMEAITFAEAGEAETARAIMTGTPADIKASSEKLEIRDHRLQALSESHDLKMEAVAFAEANEHSHAREILREEEKEKKKILVIGSEEGYSDELIQYALGMADRMNYEIVALNVIPVGKRLFNFLADNVRAELQSRAQSAAQGFAALAAEKKIPFTHLVRFGDTDKTVKEVHKEKRRVSFILTEPEAVPESQTYRPSIPVFCLANR
jgi:hypothetical protein